MKLNKKTTSKISSLIFLITISLSVQAEIREAFYSTRLIIGFHSGCYQNLGGATEATEYINKHQLSDNPISLIRPLGNSSILIHINHNNRSELQRNINHLLLLNKVRYIDIDNTMNPLRDKHLRTAPLR